MRSSIQKKLVAFIVVPTILIFLIVGGATLYRLNSRLEEQARQDAGRLAQHYADLLDGRFNTVSQVALSTAAFLESNPDVTEDQLYELLRRNVTQNQLIFGGAIAFAPFSFTTDRRLFCPYVCEDGEGGLRQLDIGTAYDYDQPAWEWWWGPRETGGPLWTAPYFDEGAGEILMSTYSVPFSRDGAFWGVATVDISLATLQDAVGLDELPRDAFAIVDQTGRFVAHPDPERILVDGLYEMAERFDQPSLAEAARRMAASESGAISLPNWIGGRGKVWVYYAPIRSTDWAFAAVLPESEALAFVRSNGWLALLGMAMILALVVTAVVLVSKSLTDPIKSLREAVQVVADGNLDVKPIEVRSHDEIGDLGHAFNQMVGDLRTHVERLAEEQAARRAVEGELEAARKIQESLIPRTFPPYPDRDDLDLHATLIPAKSVAGDFFDFFLLDDDTLVFTISDVSGKGVPAALFMAVARTLLRNLATVTRDPGEIFRRCSSMLNQDNPGAMFVTSFLGVYDIARGTVTYANAAHPPPYRVDAQGNVSSFGEATGLMLGIIEGAEYETAEGRLGPGEHLVLYTDGVTEAGATGGEMLEDEGFIRILREAAAGDSAAICAHVCTRVAEFQGGAQDDDITVLVLGRPA